MANVYYVNNGTGSDSNSGFSTSLALASLSKAASLVSAGDTVYVMASGTPYSESFEISADGTASAPITFVNYAGHSPVVNGYATNAGGGLPQGNWSLYNPSYLYWKNNGTGVARANTKNLVKITGDYVVWDGIRIRGSLGRGIAVYGNAAHVTIQNCTLGPNFQSNAVIERATYVTLDNIVSVGSGSYYPQARGTTPGTDGCASITFKAAHNCTLSNSRLYNNWGEVVIADANVGLSSYITITGCIFYDNMKGVYLHGSDHVTLDGNFLYRTDAEIANATYNDGAKGTSIGSVENENFDVNLGAGGTYITVTNNVIRGFDIGINVKGGDRRQPVDNIYVANNTVVLCNTGYELSVRNKTNCTFKNNISYKNTVEISDKTAGFTTIGAHGSSNWTIDYNSWESAVHANVTGANDITGNPGLVNYNFATTAGNGDVTKYRLTSGSAARGTGADLSAKFTTDFNGDTRSAWDMGAFEYDGATAPTATNSPSTSSGAAPLTVTFTGGPGSMTSYAWDFGDGNTSTSQSPVHIYESPGVYTATITVTDSNGLTDSASQTITVITSGSGSAPFFVETVLFDAGASTYTVSGTTAPKAALYFYGGGISNATPVNDAVFGIGIAAGSSLATQYAIGSFGEDNVSPTNTAKGIVSDYAVFFPNSNGLLDFGANITGATATTVSMTWTGTAASQKVASLNFGGEAVTNANIKLVVPQTLNNTYTISGDWNVAIMPFVALEPDSNQGAASFSMGWAVKGGNQMCVAYHNRDNQSSSDVRSETFTDRIAHTFRYGYGLQISSWTASGITFKTIEDDGTTVNSPVLLFKVSGYNVEAFIESSPTATSAFNYTSNYGYDLQAVLGMTTYHVATDTLYTSATPGVFGLFLGDGTLTRTVAIAAEDAVSPSNETSYTDVKWVQYAADGSADGVGAIAMITNGFRITPTTAISTAYAMPVLAVETSAAGTGLTALFTYVAQTIYTPDTTIQFYDLSDGASSWLWDFGDGDTSTSQNPTHQYADTGTYNVTLEIDGGGGLLTSQAQQLIITTGPATISYSLTPSVGAPPLTIALDASTSTAATGKTIDEERISWGFKLNNNSENGGDVPTGGFGGWINTKGHEASVTLYDEGMYDLYIQMWHTDGTGSDLYVDDAVTVSNTTWSADFVADYPYIASTGPFDVTFTPTVDHPLAAGSTYDWDFGDTQTTNAGYEAVTNTYATVGTKTSYDVELVITYPDGTTDTITKTDYITIVPATTAPDTITEMLARLTTLETVADSVREHLGIIDGTWVVDATYTNVYTITLDRIWTTGITEAVIEDGSQLAAVASIAAANNLAGSYYVSFSTPNITISVHPTGSTNPNTNGSVYRFDKTVAVLTTTSTTGFDPSVTYTGTDTPRWFYGDGTGAVGASVSHNYGSAGTRIVTLNVADYSKVTKLDVRNDNVTSVNVAELTGLLELYVQDNAALVFNIATTTFPTGLQYFQGNACTIMNGAITSATWPASLIYLVIGSTAVTGDASAVSWPAAIRTLYLRTNTNISYGTGASFASLTYNTIDVKLEACGLSQTEVDAVLADFVAGSINAGTLTIQNNAVPSATGLTDKATLQGRGWTVTTD